MNQSKLFVVAVCLAATVHASGCLLLAGHHWEENRQTVIEPINAAVHRHLPKDIKAKNLDGVIALYATDSGSGLPWNEPVDITGEFRERRLRWQGPTAVESIHDRYQALFGQFDTIEKAEVRIHRVHWDQQTPAGYPAELHFVIRGSGPGGEKRIVDQHARVTLDYRGGSWVLTGEEITTRELLETKQARFDVMTDTAGIHNTHDTSGSPVFRLIGNMAGSSGVAVGDFDCDGFEDLALASSHQVALYHNNADGSFSDATAAMGLPAAVDIAATGLVFFDADNDGDPDLWVCGIVGERFYRNNGCSQLVDATADAGLRASRWSSMPIVADYDRDGYLDVYVVRMGDHEKTAPSPNWNARNGLPDTLYRNNGDGTFADVTAAAGIDETGWGLAGAWGDYDNDGNPDFYVGNEFGFKSLYRNNGNGTFSNVTEKTGTQDRGAAMGIAWGDYDGDGNLDLYISNMYANSRWALFHPEFPSPVPWYLSWVPRSDIDQVIEELTRGSTLLRNNGDGTFTDVSGAAGIRDGQWGWGAEFIDYDNNGQLDIYAANGFITGPLPDDI